MKWMITSINKLLGRNLSQPILITAFEIDGHFYANNTEYMIFGEGTSQEDAMDSFIRQLEHMYTQYMKINAILD